MTCYDLHQIEEFRISLMGIYLIKLNEFYETGKVPSGFDSYCKFAKEAVKFFPEKEKKVFEELLDTGRAQAEFVRASGIYNALKKDEKKRLSKMEKFLNGFKKKQPDLFKLKI